MFPPPQGLHLDIEALSGICGSISIACWIVVFSPQIIENFRRRSAEGLSIVFIIVWLAGDVFNILGAVLQGVLPTMIILAVYYTLADIVLLGQCFYYRGFTLSDHPTKPSSKAATIADTHADHPNEASALLDGDEDRYGTPHHERRRSSSAFRPHNITAVDGTHLSPVTPLLEPPKPTDPPAISNLRPTSALETAIWNFVAVLLVCGAGVFGWWLGVHSGRGAHHHHGADERYRAQEDVLRFNTLGQVFGYFCALLYLGSRLPQILLNFRRKSTEGVSMLFFIFACIGNLTYVLSIVAFSPVCRVPGRCGAGEAKTIYFRYMAVNASWLLGSFGTLLLDMAIFLQFFIYRQKDPGFQEEEAASEETFHDAPECNSRGRNCGAKD